MKSTNLQYFPQLTEIHGVKASVCFSLVLHRFKNQKPKEEERHLPYWVKDLEGAFILGCEEVDNKELAFLYHAKNIMNWYKNYKSYMEEEDTHQTAPFTLVYSRYSRAYVCIPNIPVLKAMLVDDNPHKSKTPVDFYS